jgi:hypothetical protein
MCHTGLLTDCEQDQDGTPDDGQRNCPKCVEFYSESKFEKLVRLVVFIIIINHKLTPWNKLLDKKLVAQLHKHIYVYLSQ